MKIKMRFLIDADKDGALAFVRDLRSKMDATTKGMEYHVENKNGRICEKNPDSRYRMPKVQEAV